MLNPDGQAAVLINELDSLVFLIEALPAHPAYTDALVAVTKAKQSLIDGRTDLHHRNMRERFDRMDGHNASPQETEQPHD